MHRRSLGRWAAFMIAAIAAFTGAVSWAGGLEVADYLDFERVQDPRISPDGAQIVYTRRWVDARADRVVSSLWIMDADGSR